MFCFKKMLPHVLLFLFFNSFSLRGVIESEKAMHYCGFSFDITNQSLGVPLTYQNITVSSNVILDGWEHAPCSSQFVCRRSGLYRFLFEAQLFSDEPARNVTFRALHNNNEIGSSIVKQELGTLGYQSTVITNTFEVYIKEDDEVWFQWKTDFITSLIPGARPSLRPSFLVAISQIQ